MTLDLLYKTHRKTFINLLQRRTKNYSVSEDILQEALLKAWQNFSQFDPKKGSLKVWFTSVLFSCLWSYMRKAKKQPITKDLDEVNEEFLIDSTEDADLLTEINEVPNLRHRDILVSCLVVGCTDQEAASLHTTTPANVRKIIQRFRDNFKRS